MSKSIGDSTDLESAPLPGATRFGRVSSPELPDFKDLLEATRASKKLTKDSADAKNAKST